MIMKKYTKYIIALAAVFASVGCTHFDDMNKNPYVVYETNSESFVQPILYNTRKQLAYCDYYIFGDLMQYTINTNFENSAQLVYNYVLSENFTNQMWSLYSQFGNAQYMLATARKECESDKGNPAMVGVALVLRSWVGHLLTDTYGNVPYSKAGIIALQGNEFDYTVPYDDQKSIYIDLLRSLEEANACFAKAQEKVEAGTLTSANFNSICDFMYNGDVEKWRRFGNSLYLRLLMRVSNKAIEESDGIISLGDEFGDINVVAKINEIYDSFLSGEGDYPVMRNIDDSARVQFSSKDSALYTSFYSTTSGNWNGEAACSTLVDKMLINYKSGKENEVNPTYKWDPRYFRYFTKALGAPSQETREYLKDYFDEKVSSLGNSLIGRYPRGIYTGDHIGDLKMDPAYAILNYDEILFIFAEAGVRAWIPMSQKAYKDMYLDANLQSILQWQVGWERATDYYTASSLEVINWMDYLDDEFDYNKALETVMRQKYVAMFWVGVEAWADYRRTGYPVMRTNGPAAMNNGTLPTRLRYPSTEAFQNAEHYTNAVNGWLNGDNNMLTEIWWSSTAESKAIRSLGRK